MVKRQHTKFGSKRLSGSGDVIRTKPGRMDRRIQTEGHSRWGGGGGGVKITIILKSNAGSNFVTNQTENTRCEHNDEGKTRGERLPGNSHHASDLKITINP